MYTNRVVFCTQELGKELVICYEPQWREALFSFFLSFSLPLERSIPSATSPFAFVWGKLLLYESQRSHPPLASPALPLYLSISLAFSLHSKLEKDSPFALSA